MASQPRGWVGWVYFAGVLMLVRGVFQIFLGILALVKNTVYVVTQNNLPAFNFTAWGWIHIVLGAVLIAAAGAVFSGRWWGRIVGGIMVGFSLLANLAFLPAYPVWSIAAGIIDVLVLYALLVRGDEVKA
ncbi:MAG TPA: hypothetical protein VHA37_07290 [Candidatus Saccharimonadales bacterium]|nr:hypothetical protein [Candidatus Saccharimonadales bacterium]